MPQIDFCAPFGAVKPLLSCLTSRFPPLLLEAPEFSGRIDAVKAFCLSLSSRVRERRDELRGNAHLYFDGNMDQKNRSGPRARLKSFLDLCIKKWQIGSAVSGGGGPVVGRGEFRPEATSWVQASPAQRTTSSRSQGKRGIFRPAD